MKQYLFLVALALVLFSCSSDDDDIVPAQGDLKTLIIGAWKIQSKTLNGNTLELNCTNGLSATRTFNETNVSLGVDLNDGNGCVTLPLSATYSIDGNTIQITAPLGDSDTWTVININKEIFQYSFARGNDGVYTETYRKI